MRWIACVLTLALAGFCQGQTTAPATEPASQAATQPTTLPAAAAPLRLMLDAQINGQGVRLAFDTGSEGLCLFRPAAERLRLQVTPPPADEPVTPGKVALGSTQECAVDLDGHARKMVLGVIETPRTVQPLVEFDGVVGWSVIRDGLWLISGGDMSVSALPALPKDIDRWSSYTLSKDAPLLVFKAGDKKILIDTGSEDGIGLPREEWKKWRSEHAEAPVTLTAGWTPATGIMVTEVGWGRKISLGKLELADTPVGESLMAGTKALQELDIEAIVGLFALSRLDVVIDWPHGTLYLRPNSFPLRPYPQNRMAAVFVPGGETGDRLSAEVLKDGPAYYAGLRNDDILVKINDIEVGDWRNNPAILPLHRFWSQPAGTKIRLTVTRDARPIEITVELKDVLPGR